MENILVSIICRFCWCCCSCNTMCYRCCIRHKFYEYVLLLFVSMAYKWLLQVFSFGGTYYTYYTNLEAGPNITCISKLSLSLDLMIPSIIYATFKEVHIIMSVYISFKCALAKTVLSSLQDKRSILCCSSSKQKKERIRKLSRTTAAVIKASASTAITTTTYSRCC